LAYETSEEEIYAGGTASSVCPGLVVPIYGEVNGTGSEGFVVEIVDDATPTLSWWQLLGGTDSDSVTALAVSGDELYAAGASQTSTGWETAAFQGAMVGADHYIVEIGDGGTPTLVWGLWLGGDAFDFPRGVTAAAVDGDEIYIGGARN